MAWKQISECLPAWLSAKIDKGTGADNGPGQVVVREIVPTSSGEQAAPVNPANGRPIVTAQTKRRPTSAVAIGLVLVVDNEEGGGRRQEGGASAAFRTRAGGGDRGCKLKLVV